MVLIAEQVAQLMHLGALAFAVSAGYVGLDRIHRDSVDSFRETLEKTCSDVKSEVVLLELDKVDWETQRVYLIHPAFVLCMVAELRLNLPLIPRAWHCFLRQEKLPLLNFIRKRRDIRLMAFLCVIDLAALLGVAAVGMWPEHAIDVSLAPPFWYPAVLTVISIAISLLYARRSGYTRTKWASVACATASGILTILCLVFPGYAEPVIAAVLPHTGALVFCLFATTLVLTVIVVACSYRLRDTEATLKDYRTKMRKHLEFLGGKRIQQILDAIENIGA